MKTLKTLLAMLLFLGVTAYAQTVDVKTVLDFQPTYTTTANTTTLSSTVGMPYMDSLCVYVEAVDSLVVGGVYLIMYTPGGNPIDTITAISTFTTTTSGTVTKYGSYKSATYARYIKAMVVSKSNGSQTTYSNQRIRVWFCRYGIKQ